MTHRVIYRGHNGFLDRAIMYTAGTDGEGQSSW